MWRYQPSAEAFGNVAWACHGRCGDFTRWRVVAQDVRLVPPEDAPASKGDAWKGARPMTRAVNLDD